MCIQSPRSWRLSSGSVVYAEVILIGDSKATALWERQGAFFTNPCIESRQEGDNTHQTLMRDGYLLQDSKSYGLDQYNESPILQQDGLRLKGLNSIRTRGGWESPTLKQGGYLL